MKYYNSENMAARECMLCITKIEKKGDCNLISGKSNFDCISELKDLSFVVQLSSNHICRACLNLLKQRAGLKEKLYNVNAKLLQTYQNKASDNGYAVKLKDTAKRYLRFVDDLSMEHPSDMDSCRGETRPNNVVLLDENRRNNQQNVKPYPEPAIDSFQPSS